MTLFLILFLIEWYFECNNSGLADLLKFSKCNHETPLNTHFSSFKKIEQYIHFNSDISLSSALHDNSIDQLVIQKMIFGEDPGAS
ncbi:hypothetical protein BpHYR1_027126 [Brachionus plicatilis]|uniref:Uncharacterized protein n=1 Tax=Brachionus plicatilis TaxID=10195 RepID=A0A3M7QDW8_BRAPC|nr:hypothetical protein BpHYR1_027126 [Brachionus plicatilis]